MPEDLQFDVFLSHSSKDKLVVRELAARMQRDGVRVWLDEEQIKPGDSIMAKIEEGMEQARVMVLCMSANAFGSEWAQLEAGTYRFRDPLNKERRFIPLRLDDAPIKGSLAQFLYINWRATAREEEYPKLYKQCMNSEGRLSNAQVMAIRELAQTVLGWSTENLFTTLDVEGRLEDKLKDWRADFEKILALDARMRIPMEPYHRKVLRIALRLGIDQNFPTSEVGPIHPASHEAHGKLNTVLRFLVDPPTVDAPSRKKQPEADSPKQIYFCTQRDTPQWSSFKDLQLAGQRLLSISCRISTDSPYFRFGFKLLTKDGRIFGDGSIQSQDSNLVVHIGRNNWNRPKIGIAAEDIFSAWYIDGIRKDEDKKRFSSPPKCDASLQLKLGEGNFVEFLINGVICLHRPVPPEISNRVVMLSWGDSEEYEINVTEFSLITI